MRDFLNRDPTDYKAGPNLYAFCDGNPVNEIDPSGTSAAALAGPIIWTLPRLAIPASVGTTIEAIPVYGTIAWGIESVGELGVYAATRGHLEGPTMQAGERLGSTYFPPTSGLAAYPQEVLMLANAKIHHIATNKHTTVWTPKFKVLFDKWGLGMDCKENLVKLDPHSGPHEAQYHRWVYDNLVSAQSKEEFTQTLKKIGNWLQQDPTKLETGPYPKL